MNFLKINRKTQIQGWIFIFCLFTVVSVNAQEVKDDSQKQNDPQEMRQRDSLEVEYQKIIVMADNAIKEKDYEAAKIAYTKALVIHPENTYALQRLKIATYQAKLASTVKDTTSFEPPTEELRNILYSKYNEQKEPIPYSDQELKEKYDTINFNQPPPAQQFNTTSVLPKDHSRLMDELIIDKPKIVFSSTDQNIHLINVDITFYDSLVYLKFILQNESDSDFLTGPMLLTWQRSNNDSIKLYPIYVYPDKFPIVKPGNQSVIVYVCKPYVATNFDYFIFDMNDRKEKIQLQVKIPGSAWINSQYKKYLIKTATQLQQ